jgi:hypothetical protein
MRLRLLVNVLNLSTPLGVLIALLGGGRLRAGPEGLLLAVGYRAPFPARAPAITIGNVILLRMSAGEALARPGLLAHESRHASQYAMWLGMLGFLPAYLVACAWSWWHTGNFALRNAFEVRAGLVDGGYLRRTVPATGADDVRQRPDTASDTADAQGV